MGGKRQRAHHKVEKLSCRQMIDKMLADGHTYQEIQDAVKEAGESIGIASLSRYYSKYAAVAERIAKTREAMQVIVDAVQDRPDTDLGKAASQMMMQSLMDRISMATGDEFEDMPLDQVGRLIANLQRSDVAREKLKLEYQRKAEKAVEQIEAKGREKGLDPDTLKFIKEQVYGIL